MAGTPELLNFKLYLMLNLNLNSYMWLLYQTAQSDERCVLLTRCGDFR